MTLGDLIKPIKGLLSDIGEMILISLGNALVGIATVLFFMFVIAPVIMILVSWIN